MRLELEVHGHFLSFAPAQEIKELQLDIENCVLHSPYWIYEETL